MIYTGENLTQISFPVGGIGTGCIGVAGNGHLIDWEIFNRPDKGTLNGWSGFAVRAEYPDGSYVIKMLQGDWDKDLIGKYSFAIFKGFGYGPESATHASLPHFKNVEFDGSFPIARLTFSDDNFPAEITMTAFNPFIPLDSYNSSIPSAFFKFHINSPRKDIKYTVAFVVVNPFEYGINTDISSGDFTAVTLKNGKKSPNEVGYGDLTAITDCENAFVQEYWYRGGWQQDNVYAFWNELKNDSFSARHYDEFNEGHQDTAVLGIRTNGESDFKIVLSWNVPNNYNYWEPYTDESGKPKIWKNYYATVFEDSYASAKYSLSNYDELLRKTEVFRDALHGMTLDESIIDAISSTLSVLKSPTVWRLQNGAFYGWEGVHEKSGSCEGTCSHVWSYAYALCFLFPDLERSIRDTEFKYNMYDGGQMRFRLRLPLDREKTDPWFPCVDGQMATVIKCYRDWKITGNTDWLKDNWDNIKKILEFAWNEKNIYEWDKNKDGVLEGRQHHTLDMELFGPSAWLQGMYLCALKAASEMAEYLGDTEKKNEYEKIFESGYKWTKENLFNGEYFIHKVDIRDKSLTEHFNCPEYWNEEVGQIKDQIADGCEIDQLLGQWHANICGLGDIFDVGQRKTALQSMFKNNFKSSLRELVNIWRVFALNDEGGAILCEYPEGKERPVIPVPYCEECMTGFEYAFAGLLISEGMIDEGMRIIKAIRNRYDGKKRNPFNEIECGSNYARAMSNFALIPIFSGFEFDLPHYTVGFSPILSSKFKTVWSLGTGWGTFETDGSASAKITIADGYIELEKLVLGKLTNVNRIFADGKEIKFAKDGKTLTFEHTKITQSIEVM